MRLLRANLRGHALRLALTGFAVVVGVAFLVATLLLSGALDRSIDGIGADEISGVALVRAPLPFDADDSGGGSLGVLATRPPLPATVVDAAAAIEGVRLAAGVVSAPGVLTDVSLPFAPGDDAPAEVTTWIGDPELDGATLDLGRAPVSVDEVVLRSADATMFEVGVGDTLDISLRDGARTLTVVGLAEPTTSAALSFDTVLGVAPTAGPLLGAPEGFVDEVRVAAAEGVAQEELIRRLEAALGPAVEVAPGDELVQAIRDLVRLLASAATGFFVVFAGIALFVGGFIIFNTFSILLARRGREIALMRAIGAGRRQVLGALLAEGLLTGLLASLLGLLVGGGLFLAVRVGAAVVADAEIALVLQPSLLLAAAAGVAVTTVAAVVPARRAASIPPIAALRESALDAEVRPWRRGLIGAGEVIVGGGLLLWGLVGQPPRREAVVGVGLALLFVAVTTLGPLAAGRFTSVVGWPLERATGPTGRLGRANAVRNPRRTASTAAALMIGVTLVVLVATFAESLKATSASRLTSSYAADVIVSGGSTLGVPDETVDAIGATDGVELAVALRATSAGIGDEVRTVIGAEPDALEEVVVADVRDGDLRALTDRGIALRAGLADDLGVAVGDAITVDLPTARRTLEVVAVYGVDDVLADAVITPAAFTAGVAPPDLVVREVLVAGAAGDGAALGRLETAVEAVAEGAPQVEVSTPQGQADALAGAIDLALVIVYGLLALSVAIALLGIANSLALSVFERRHELGLLRAVGMTASQAAATVRGEAVLVALFGTAQGVVLGLAFGAAVVAAQSDAVLALPWVTVAVAFVVAVGAGVLAAVVPAWRAGRTDIVSALGST
nr:ABC transporter permease [Rhabdothermincola salaria]